eukprot:CFRG0470T1
MSFADIDRNGHGSGRVSDDNAGAFSQTTYKNVTRTVSQNVFRFSSNVNRIRDLNGLLGGPRDTQRVRQDLSRIREDTSEIARETTDSLKELTTKDWEGSDNEKQRNKIQLQKLSRQFAALLHTFELLQKSSIQKEKETVSNAKESLFHIHEEEEKAKQASTSTSEDTALLSYQHMIQNITLENSIEYNEALIVEREEGIRAIETSISEVNEIFRDLGAIVLEQGQMLDDIEHNVVTVHETVVAGSTEVRAAENYQKKARGKMCCLLYIFLIILAIVLLIAFVSRFH